MGTGNQVNEPRGTEEGVKDGNEGGVKGEGGEVGLCV